MTSTDSNASSGATHSLALKSVAIPARVDLALVHDLLSQGFAKRIQRAVRVRTLKGVDAIAAAKIWKRELQRRERARVKRIASMIDDLNREVDSIARYAPDTKLPADLAAAVRQVYLPIIETETKRKNEERKRRLEEERLREKAALAELSALFPEPPAPPPPILMADIRKRNTAHDGRGGSTYYEIEGSLEDVQIAIAQIKEWHHPSGYGTRFDTPAEIADGRWLSRGSHSNSCD